MRNSLLRKGFTLIELMIVVVIIGILAAIAIPKFNDVSESSKRNACRANMRTIASQQVLYFMQNTAYAPSLGDLDLSGVVCPSRTLYTVTGTTTSFSILCNAATGSHGNITDGIASWITSAE